MRTLGGFILGTVFGHWLLAHVALQVIAWQPLAVKLWLK
jgi:hypothetical protein